MKKSILDESLLLSTQRMRSIDEIYFETGDTINKIRYLLASNDSESEKDEENLTLMKNTVLDSLIEFYDKVSAIYLEHFYLRNIKEVINNTTDLEYSFKLIETKVNAKINNMYSYIKQEEKLNLLEKKKILINDEIDNIFRNLKLNETLEIFKKIDIINEQILVNDRECIMATIQENINYEFDRIMAEMEIK